MSTIVSRNGLRRIRWSRDRYVTWPRKVKLVTPKRLSPISQKQLEMLWASTVGYPRLATAWLLVLHDITSHVSTFDKTRSHIHKFVSLQQQKLVCRLSRTVKLQRTLAYLHIWTSDGRTMKYSIDVSLVVKRVRDCSQTVYVIMPSPSSNLTLTLAISTKRSH